MICLTSLLEASGQLAPMSSHTTPVPALAQCGVQDSASQSVCVWREQGAEVSAGTTLG
jgi:hypothetical protein